MKACNDEVNDARHRASDKCEKVVHKLISEATLTLLRAFSYDPT